MPDLPVRVAQSERIRMQPQAVHPAISGKRTVLFEIAVSRVAENGMENMLQVAAQLMAASAFRAQGDEAVTRTGMAAVGKRQFVAPQKAQAAVRGLCRAAFLRGQRVKGLQRIINALACRPAAHQRQIGFAHLLVFKLRGKLARGVRVAGKYHDARGRAVKAVDRIKTLPDLIAQGLQEKSVRVAVNRRAVHQQSGGFVDHNQRLILMDDGDGRFLDRGKMA